MRIRKIVLTGGPSAGKTTGLTWIQNAISKLGYTVLFVPETATELISGGVAPWTCGTNLDYQKGQMRLQLEKESSFYYKTYKRRAPDGAQIEVEEPLSREEYADLLLEADPDRRPLHKTRYGLTFDGRYFEVEIYPFWNDRALLEVELRAADEEVRFPPELNVLRDVTEDEAYQTAALAAQA